MPNGCIAIFDPVKVCQAWADQFPDLHHGEIAWQSREEHLVGGACKRLIGRAVADVNTGDVVIHVCNCDNAKIIKCKPSPDPVTGDIVMIEDLPLIGCEGIEFPLRIKVTLPCQIGVTYEGDPDHVASGDYTLFGIHGDLGGGQIPSNPFVVEASDCGNVGGQAGVVYKCKNPCNWDPFELRIVAGVNGQALADTPIRGGYFQAITKTDQQFGYLGAIHWTRPILYDDPYVVKIPPGTHLTPISPIDSSTLFPYGLLFIEETSDEVSIDCVPGVSNQCTPRYFMGILPPGWFLFDPNNCDIPALPPHGICCPTFNNETGEVSPVNCIVTSEEECASLEGTWNVTTTDCSECEPMAYGICCPVYDPDTGEPSIPACIGTFEENCAFLGGVFIYNLDGDPFINCDCCWVSPFSGLAMCCRVGTCSMKLLEDCNGPGDYWFGGSLRCGCGDDIACLKVINPCCLGAFCQDGLTVEECFEQGGTPLLYDSCAEVPASECGILPP